MRRNCTDINQRIISLSVQGYSRAAIVRELRVAAERVRAVLGPEKENRRDRVTGSKDPLLQGVPQLPDEVAHLLSRGHEPTTPEAQAGMAGYIEAACAELRKRQQANPPRQPAAEIPRVRVIIGNVRGGVVSL